MLRKSYNINAVLLEENRNRKTQDPFAQTQKRPVKNNTITLSRLNTDDLCLKKL